MATLPPQFVSQLDLGPKMSSHVSLQQQSKFTAGAVLVLKAKGEVSMQKVKVTRYVAGKRPLFAHQSSSESDYEPDTMMLASQTQQTADFVLATLPDAVVEEPTVEDRRLRRLKGALQDTSLISTSRGRYIADPEILAERVLEKEAEEDDEKGHRHGGMVRKRHIEPDNEEDKTFEEEDIDEEKRLQRRALLRERSLLLAKQQELEMEVTLGREEKPGAESEESESEYEEYSDSEAEDNGPRIKPIFILKNNRITMKPELERRETEETKIKENHNKHLEDRKMESLRIASNIASSTVKATAVSRKLEAAVHPETMITDDENEEEEYEAWKVRELKRIKRERKDLIEEERQETERIRNFTEKEREQYYKENPKNLPTNKAPKGKHRHLQKYYHKGVFYSNDDERLLRRDTSAPTLEDHFDKTVLPKVMQVKNFGRSGCTKYTHLVDQDTTDYEAAWVQQDIAGKFQSSGGGIKRSFSKPSKKKQKVAV